MTGSNYLTLTTFVPGTKAKADEVNSNFSILKDAVVSKAPLEGDSSQTFLVADATADSHAVNKKQLSVSSDELKGEIKKTGPKFCVRSGYTTSGKGDIFSYSALQITPKIGSGYANLVIADYVGNQYNISSVSPLSMTGKTDGVYNIFIKSDGTLYVLKNNIYKQAARPTLVEGDIWLNTSSVPFKCIKYVNSTDEDFLDVPLGQVVIANSTILSLVTFPFNQNGYDVNAQTPYSNWSDSYIDYTTAVSKAINTVHTADEYGYILNYLSGSVSSSVTIDGQTFGWSVSNSTTSTQWAVKKGLTYSATGGLLTFYPTKGDN